MKFHSHHGVLSQETIIGASYEVNVLIEADLTKAYESDNVEDTINYAYVSENETVLFVDPDKIS